MIDLGFAYYAVTDEDDADRINSLFARLAVSEGPLQAVIWHVGKQAWKFMPGVAAELLFDDRLWDQRHEVDRSEAERIAREILGTELPSEEELRRMCADGLSRWDFKTDPDGNFVD